MSRDSDPQQRRWLSMGYGGKTSPGETWRYWKTADQTWTIAAPLGLAEFELKHRTVFYMGRELFTEDTQWRAQWRALAYFYSEVLPGLRPPPLGSS
jgi:hypothetical protein